MDVRETGGTPVDTAFTEYRGNTQRNGSSSDDDDLLGESGDDLSKLGELGGPWQQWSDDQKKTMMLWLNYELDIIARAKDKIEEINKCWAKGPIPKSQVKKVPTPPKTDLSFIYTEGKSKEKGTGDDNEFIDYLKSKCSNNENTDEHFDEMSTSDLDEMAEHLRKRFIQLGKATNTLLLEHISVGGDLERAKNLFKSLSRKRRNQSKISWELWISNNVKICKRYANKHILVYRLVTEYPELKKLTISFKELYAISGKIRTVFSRNNAEGLKWK